MEYFRRWKYKQNYTQLVSTVQNEEKQVSKEDTLGMDLKHIDRTKDLRESYQQKQESLYRESMNYLNEERMKI